MFQCKVSLLTSGISTAHSGVCEVYIKEEDDNLTFWSQYAGVCINQIKFKKSIFEKYEPDGKLRAITTGIVNDFLKDLSNEQSVNVSYNDDKRLIIISVLSALGLPIRVLEFSEIQPVDSSGKIVGMGMPNLDYDNIPNFRANAKDFCDMLKHMKVMKGKEKTSVLLVMKDNKIYSREDGDTYRVEEVVKLESSVGGESKVSIATHYIDMLYKLGAIKDMMCQCWVHQDKPFVFKLNHKDFEFIHMLAPLIDNK